ncbi:tRNA threonylcarbamoyladenosine dehydratase [Dehalobacter sp. DCM]|uniref:tRNA threonylcarbamoyladenosine dehydratase n=1 Tax=Dehalobacter sp. DCM TaxID=2907827 RepID=UPI0030812C58|nr:tRNA threonylcarbamoyladenosine dehydratase [Dehalobacter sp. DCM]
MQNQFSRTELLIGQEGLLKLQNSKIIIFGLGGVGSYTAEALVRAGVGHFKLVDFDEICLTNINRQLHALHSTIGKSKVEVMKQRMLDINPKAKIETVQSFYQEEGGAGFFAEKPDYVVDAIDTVKSKVSLAKECCQRGIPLISCMGAGNRLDALSFRVADISKTSGCPLAKSVRKLLREEGITTGFRVVFSPEPALKPLVQENSCASDCICPSGDAHCAVKRQIPGSISYVPSVAGLIMAGEVINGLIAANYHEVTPQ